MNDQQQISEIYESLDFEKRGSEDSSMRRDFNRRKELAQFSQWTYEEKEIR